MSEIYKVIRSDIVKSMKERNGETTILRSLDASIQVKALNDKIDITDSLVIDVISKGIKQREESIIMFDKGNRKDLADKEKEEIEIYKRYQPKQLTESEVVTIIEEVIQSVGATSKKDLGNVMKIVVGKTKGLFDGKRVSELVRSKL
jgi:hypothetical protein